MKKITLFIMVSFCAPLFAQKKPLQLGNSKAIDSLHDLVSKEKDENLQVKHYYEISNSYYQLGNIEKAEIYAKMLLAQSEKLQNEKGISMGHTQLADLNITSEKYTEATEHAKIAYEGLKKLNEKGNALNAVYLLAAAYGALGQNDQAISTIENALEEIKGPYLFPRAKLYFELSNSYYSQNDFLKTLDNLQKALKNFNTLKYPYGITNCYSNLANVYIKTKDWQKARKYCLLHFEGFKNATVFIPSEYAMSLKRMGNVEMKLGNYTQSLNYLQKALEYCKKHKLDNRMPEILKMQGEAYLFCQEPEKAITVLKTALNNKITAKAEVYSLLQKAYSKLNDTKNANHYKAELVALLGPASLKARDTINNIELYKDLAKASESAGKYKDAYFYHEKYADLQNKEFQKEKRTRVNELQAKFELTDKDLKLKDLTINKQKNELKMASQKSLLLATIAILSVIFIISLFLYWRYRLNKKSNFILTNKNEQIENSLQEKNVLLREIHHRVKNNLQLIISLLNIQARENNHLEVDAFLEKGRGRIISMALIHQNLYEADNLAKVNFQEYLENLIHSNTEVYGYDCCKIVFSIDANELYFDVQTSIPLGLIINELICNAVKHAFGDYENGLIAIRIQKKESGTFELLFSDNGLGIANTKKEGKTFGIDLVNLLAMQLKGEVEVNSIAGTTYHISFEDLAA